MKKLDQYGQGRHSVLIELKKYNLKEMQKLQKVIDATPEDKTNLKAFAKRQLLIGHSRQLIKTDILLDVKIKKLKTL